MSMNLRGKTILLISQQDWGTMFISKHHYAVELAKRGNKVFFLNSPVRNRALKAGEVVVEATAYENLSVVKHRFFYPYIVKHKARKLHYRLLKMHLSKILAAIGPVDIVWSFDFSDTMPVRLFPAKCFKIFMPVDEPQMPEGMQVAEGADVIMSVTKEILSKYDSYKLPSLFVNHGVKDVFLANGDDYVVNDKKQVGLSGNFLRADIDWECLLSIVKEHRNVTFNFYGAFDASSVNLASYAHSGDEEYRMVFKSLDNVYIHGVVAADKLAEELKGMDAFLICYDIQKDFSGGTNYHKVLEYMATGRVIVSNNITTYDDDRKLVEMPAERNNLNLPGLFSKVIHNLDYYNSPAQMSKRIAFAREHTYAGNLDRIEAFIEQVS